MTIYQPSGTRANREDGMGRVLASQDSAPAPETLGHDTHLRYRLTYVENGAFFQIVKRRGHVGHRDHEQVAFRPDDCHKNVDKVCWRADETPCPGKTCCPTETAVNHERITRFHAHRPDGFSQFNLPIRQKLPDKELLRSPINR